MSIEIDWPDIVAYLRFKASGRYDEDLGQTALLGVWRHVKAGGATDAGLLKTVAYRRYLDALRRRNGRSYRKGISVYPRPAVVPLDVDLPDATGRTDFDTIDALDVFDRALARLSPKHRQWVLEIVGLRQMMDAGGSIVELAEAQGLSRSALSKRIGDRRKRLAPIIGELVA